MDALDARPLAFGDREQIAALRRREADAAAKEERETPGVFVVDVSYEETFEIAAANADDAVEQAVDRARVQMYHDMSAHVVGKQGMKA